MNDIKNITEKIISDAKAQVAANENIASAKAEESIEACRKKAEKMIADSEFAAKREADAAVERAENSQKMSRRNMLLKAKCEVLDEAFVKAKEQLCNADRQVYLDFLVKLFGRTMTACDGVLMLNEKDLQSVGNDFYTQAKKLFEKEHPDFALTLCDTAADIDGGFILKNGDIEYNCSVSSVLNDFRAKRENDIFKLLFD